MGRTKAHGHQDWVASVAFSPDGHTLVSAGGDETVRLWDVHGRKQLGAPLRYNAGHVYSVAVSPDGRTLATAGRDRTVRLWTGILWHDIPDLRKQVCKLVVGNLTPAEWDELVPDLTYRTTCTD
jgi:WD40 repeat protein